MAKSTKNSSTAVLTTATIRAAFRDGRLDATKVLDTKGQPVSTASLLGKDGTGEKVRGRLHPAFAAYAEANLGGTFKEKVKAEKVISLAPVRVGKDGRKRTLKAREVPVSEVRRLGGVSAKGRIPAAAYEKAALALGAL